MDQLPPSVSGRLLLMIKIRFQVDVIFLNSTKAFNHVRHTYVTQPCSYYKSVFGDPLLWFKSYLSHCPREHYISLIFNFLLYMDDNKLFMNFQNDDYKKKLKGHYTDDIQW